MKSTLKSLYRFFSPKFHTIHLDYHIQSKPRNDISGHEQLKQIIEQNRDVYRNYLHQFLQYSEQIFTIKDSAQEKTETNPVWNNGFLPGLDIITLYGMLAQNKPAHYIEIGSGNSTRVARKAITEHLLKTEITSVDPFPRANIDVISDIIVRSPLENIDDLTFITEKLNEHDILFIDNSHLVFPNSDATICFLEILPKLRKGVIVHFHDIYLPYDYPQFMCDRYYNEQYMLAAFLLADHRRYKTILPNYFISRDPELSNIVAPFWAHPGMANVERHGGSFWIQIN